MSRGAVYTFQLTIADTNLRNCFYLNFCLSFDIVFVFIFDERGQFTCPAHLFETRLSKFSLILPPDINKVIRYTVLIFILKAAARPKYWHCQNVGGVFFIPQNLPPKKLLKLSMIFRWWAVEKVMVPQRRPVSSPSPPNECGIL